MSKGLPFVSIVVPAFNEELMLPTCLQALTEQDYKGKYEFIVVDNNSNDLTSKIANVYGARIIKEKHQGVAIARQKGFEGAKGEIILSTDADTIVPTNWISRMVKEINKDAGIVAVGGACNLIGTNTPLKLLSASLAPLMFLLDKLFDYPGTLQGWNFGVKREAFLETGGFDTTLQPGEIGEDRDLGKRLRKIGHVKILYKLKVKTSARRFVGFFKSLKYVFINYLYISFKKRPVSGTFQTIRQKPYETYDVVNDKPFFITLIFLCVALILLLLGIIPGINLWSTSSAKTQNKIIALTFDDNSNSKSTIQLITLLKQKNIEATFFVTGSTAKTNPALVKSIYNNGNTIGNYSMTTKSTLMLNTSAAIIKDINTTDDYIYGVIGKKPKFFRPPHGYRSIWGAISLDKYGYETVTWSNASDPGIGKVTSKKIAIDVIKNSKPGDIIDLQTSDQSVKATEEIIDLLQADGYKFVTLDTLLGKPAYF